MNRLICHAVVFAIVLTELLLPSARAQYLDQIGLTLLRATTTNLNGAGVKVGQAEAALDYSASLLAYEASPAATGQPTNLFTWILGSSPYILPPSQSSVFTNSLGAESYHADNVGNDFYGMATNTFGIPLGVATNVAHVNNYEANTFINYYINNNHAITERIVNQSFTWGSVDTNVDEIYDNYAAQYGVLFVNGAGLNNNPVWSPATCYNGVGVGVFNNGGSPYGPTPDGRSKPDITAFGNQDTVTSYSTAQVSGGAALLMQAGNRGDGGANTNAATDIRTLKALLLNGAVKPADWTNSPNTPLHYRYGAGVLNVFNSHQQLIGAKNSCIASNTVALGGAHPPTGAGGTIGVLSGWDFTSLTSSSTNDAVNHYFFNVTNTLGSVTAAATLVWNRHKNQTAINDLNLFLYNCANSNLVACSTSLVDNVEHIFVPQLAPGRYDLQVWKAGGSFVSATETNALAFAFVPVKLNLARAGTNAVLSWPVYPAGFVVEATTNLAAPTWSTNNFSATLTGSTNIVTLPMTNAAQFFRLQSPNF